MSLTIDPEFERMIPPLTPEELDALRDSIATAGRALDPIKVWRGVILDGHNRYRICTELGLPYETQAVRGVRSREAARKWMLKHQRARRSLTRDQLLMLHIARGEDPPPSATPQEADTARAGLAQYGDDVIAGRLTIRQVRNRLRPKPPKGPAEHVPTAHEVAGLSTLTGPDGEVRGQWTKTRVAGADEPEIDPREHGHLLKGVSQMKRGDGSTVVQWESWASDERKREDAMRAAWARHASVYAGLAGVAGAPDATDEDLVTLYPIGDPHIGMLAWAPETGAGFDLKIATAELVKCLELLVAGVSPSEHAIICNLGDFFHAQDDMQVTPGHGHKLDVDGRHAKVLDAGHAVLRKIIDLALAKHERVTIRNLPGNHDPRVSAELAMWLRAVYEREPRVTVADAFAAHQYDRFGRNLFGWHHGDRTPMKELPAIMATDRAEDWGQTEHRVWHVGHVHHKNVDKEFPGCVVESHNTMAGRDAYHAGRYRARQQLQAIQYHREYGEHNRKTVNLSRVQAALKGQQTHD